MIRETEQERRRRFKVAYKERVAAEVAESKRRWQERHAAATLRQEEAERLNPPSRLKRLKWTRKTPKDKDSDDEE